jgi:hypothetical protein
MFYVRMRWRKCESRALSPVSWRMVLVMSMFVQAAGKSINISTFLCYSEVCGVFCSWTHQILSAAMINGTN